MAIYFYFLYSNVVLIFFFFLNPCDNIAQMDERFIANETHQSDSRNYIELDESQTSNNEKK